MCGVMLTVARHLNRCITKLAITTSAAAVAVQVPKGQRLATTPRAILAYMMLRMAITGAAMGIRIPTSMLLFMALLFLVVTVLMLVTMMMMRMMVMAMVMNTKMKIMSR